MFKKDRLSIEEVNVRMSQLRESGLDTAFRYMKGDPTIEEVELRVDSIGSVRVKRFENELKGTIEDEERGLKIRLGEEVK